MTVGGAPARIEVVSAVIARCGRVMLAQRDPARSDYGWAWESPGGKVEPGEQPADALARELREEIGVDAMIAERLEVFTFDPDERTRIVRPCTVTFYSALIDDNAKPRPIEGIGLGWFTPDELSRLVMVPGNDRYRHGLVSIARASR